MSVESIPHNEPAQDPEDQIEEMLNRLPPELRSRWEEILWNDAPSPTDALVKLSEMVAQRSRALKPKHHDATEISINERHLSPEEREGMRKESLEIARKIIERTNNVIGEGGTATVHSSEQYPGTCYKYIFDTEFNEDYLDFNDVFEELHIMDGVYPLTVDGVRCPKPRFAFAEGGITVLVMEELPAVSLKKVLAGAGRLPENFDVNRFLEQLSSYLDQLHTKHNTYHRDLHDGNIMIDNTGAPYIIDFGRSVRGVLGTEDPYKRYDRATGELVGRYNDDMLQLELHRKALWDYVRKRTQ